MCGIAGFWSLNSSLNTEEGRALIRKMTDQIQHRGPDADGHWHDDNTPLFLGHRRLSIQDLSEAGAQPMHSQNDRFIMIFNGEIYNKDQLQKSIATIATETRYKGTSDTEVLLESFALLGLRRTLDIIKGMFAIALWDKKEKRLHLIRDHIGKKPLYVGYVGPYFAFASELKSLLPLDQNSLRMSEEAFRQYNYFGFIPSHLSIYEGVYKIKPGHILTLSINDVNTKNHLISISKQEVYWELNTTDAGADTYDLRECLMRTVKQRMVSDVPLGAFLSGGIDSSLVSALMQEQSSKPIKTYSIGFQDTALDESKHAERIAQHLGTDHTTYHVNEIETQKIIPDLFKVYDEPFSDYSQIPTIALCQQAKKDTTVALSGDGGDEVFCGYKRYFMLQKLLSFSDKFSSCLKGISSNILSAPPQSLYNKIGLNGKRIHSIAGFIKERGFDEAVLRTLSVNTAIKQPCIMFDIPSHLNGYERMMYIDTHLYLPDDILVKVDRASMFTSLEVRSPLLDKEVIEHAWRMPIESKIFEGQGRGKKPLYQLLCDYVPEDLINRPKQGFTPPISEWLKGDLKDWAQDLINTPTNLYEKQKIQKMWHDFLSGKVDNHTALWTVLMAQSWAINNTLEL